MSPPVRQAKAALAHSLQASKNAGTKTQQQQQPENNPRHK